MPLNQYIHGRRIAVLAADGVEKTELMVPIKAFRLAGAKVDVVSLRNGRIRSVHRQQPSLHFRVNKSLSDASTADYDGLFIPGGFLNPDLLRQSEAARAFVRAFDNQDKPIASLCHGPWVLASAGILAGRTVTSWPGVRDDLVNAGATWLNEEIVHDRNLITGRSQDDIAPFVRAVKRQLSEREPVNRSKSLPAKKMESFSWLPRPSIGVAVGLSLLSLFLFIPRSTRKPGRTWKTTRQN